MVVTAALAVMPEPVAAWAVVGAPEVTLDRPAVAQSASKEAVRVVPLAMGVREVRGAPVLTPTVVPVAQVETAVLGVRVPMVRMARCFSTMARMAAMAVPVVLEERGVRAVIRLAEMVDRAAMAARVV